jgi:ribosomal protein L37E
VRQPAPELPYAERIAQAKRMAAAGQTTAEIASHIGMSTTSVRRYLRAEGCRRCGSRITASATGYCASCIFEATHVALYTRDEILERLGDWHELEGYAPRCTDWALGGKGPRNRYEREYPHWPPASSAAFGSWRAMLRVAGMPAHQREAWTRQDVLDALNDAAARLGRTPTIAHAKGDRRLPTISTVSALFGSWNLALRAAGLTPSRIAPRQWDKVQIVAVLRQFERDHGRSPTGPDFTAADGAPTQSTVAAHFRLLERRIGRCGSAPTNACAALGRGRRHRRAAGLLGGAGASTAVAGLHWTRPLSLSESRNRRQALRLMEQRAARGRTVTPMTWARSRRLGLRPRRAADGRLSREL